MARKSKYIYFRYVAGNLVPADQCAKRSLHEKKFKEGDLLKAQVSKLRTVGFNKFSHRLGVLITQNIEDFRLMTAHAAIKRLQYEGNIYCEELPIKIIGFDLKIWEYVRTIVQPILSKIGFSIQDDGYIVARIPRSFSFDSMGEEEYRDAVSKICVYLAENYWQTCTPEQIEAMADGMPDDM